MSNLSSYLHRIYIDEFASAKLWICKWTSSSKLADRQSLKLRELFIANVRPVWELCHGYWWHWSLCSRVMMLAMLMWLRQGGWARALFSGHGWLTPWYSPCACPGPSAPAPSSSWPESLDNGLYVLSTPVSLQNYEGSAEKNKENGQLDISSHQGPMNREWVSVCWCVIFKLQKDQYYKAYCQLWPCVLK